MSHKFKEETCENCGLDLTKAEPVRVREMPSSDGMIFVGHCPCCEMTYNLGPVPEVAPEGEPPRARVRRREEPTPEPTPEPESEPAAEPESEAAPE